MKPYRPTTFLDLCYAMKMGVMVEIMDIEGTIKSIERAHDSGRCYLVTFERNPITHPPMEFWEA